MLGSFSVFSSSTVRRIMATDSSRFSILDARPRRRTERAASSLRPFRTNHHGDSGANQRRWARGVGNIHWSAIGILAPSCQQSRVARTLPVLHARGKERAGTQVRGSEYVPIGGWLGQTVVTVGDGTHDDGSDGPEHLQHLRGRGSQPDGDKHTTKNKHKNNEDAPRHTLEELRY